MRLPVRVKRVTNPVIGRVPVPIMSGPNRGLWWSLASAGHGYMTGRRAARQMDLVSALVGQGDVVWDIGAHHGFVTLCASRRVGPGGEVHAFEPSNHNLWFISRHLAWNAIGNVTIHPYALSHYDGESCFGGNGTSKTFALGRGEERVTVRCGQTVVQGNTVRPPTFAKLDVEGAEGEVIAGLIDVLPDDSILLIAVHSRQAYEQCSDLLGPRGFTMLPSRSLCSSLDGGWCSDPDMLCVGPEHSLGALTQRLLRASGFE